MKLNLVNSIKKSQPTFDILILFFKNYYYYFKCVGVLPACIYVLYVHHIVCCLRGQEKEADVLQLKLHAVVE